MHANGLYDLKNQDMETYSPEDDISMASNLYWRPICDNDEPLDKKLKWILHEEEMLNGILSMKDIGFFKGLRAAGIEGAQVLIDALERFGHIQLFEK